MKDLQMMEQEKGVLRWGGLAGILIPSSSSSPW